MTGTQKVNFEKRYCPNCFQQFEGLTLCPNDGTTLRGSSNDPLIGKVFAERYEIESVLGLGGMSIVYKAKHRLMNRTVAIKMLHGKLKEDVTSLERFKLEAQAASSLSHQNIITVYDFGVTDDGEPFFVMDCLEGESLEDLIERKPNLPLERALPIFKQICAGLDAAHKKGIVHRDLKPANVVLIREQDGSELVKIVDFGIAKILPGAGIEQQQLTKTGEIFGSPIYMSPEQCLGKELDTRSDLYAFGCLMYDVLAGGPPFRGESILETMNMHVNEAPRPIKELMPDANVPPELEEIIVKCMAKNPAERFQTASEIQDLLGAISANLLGKSGRFTVNTGPTQKVAKAPELKLSAPYVVLGIGFAILLGAFGFTALWPGPSEDRGTILDKSLWQVTLSQAESALNSKDYTGADAKLAWCEAKARTFGDAKHRLEATLKLKSDLYNVWEGHAEDLEKVNKEMIEIGLERLRAETDSKMKVLAGFDATSKSEVAQTSAKLRAEAQVPSIVLTSAKLHGAGLYSEEDKLLSKSLELERKMLGNDSVQVIQLEARLADCLVAEKKYGDARPLLTHVREIRKKDKDSKPLEYVVALNKLGQFDLDQNDFENAKPELAESLAEARKLSGTDKSANYMGALLSAVRSNADLYRQTKQQDKAEKLLEEARALEKQGAHI